MEPLRRISRQGGSRARWALEILVLAVLLLGRTGVAPGRDAYRVEDFGTKTGEPIDTGFFFHEGKYIEAPYVVERRGLDIYINEVLVMPGPTWALYDYKVETDPGDPPEGASPFDTYPEDMDLRDTYWSRKWRYLYSHYEHETATKKMLETYRKSTAIAGVEWSRDQDLVRLTHQGGTRLIVDLSLRRGGFAIDPPSMEEIIERVEAERAFQESRLRKEVVLFKKGGLSIVVGGRRALKALEILLSDAPEDQKVRALQEANVLHRGRKGEFSRWVVTDFVGSPQLAERARQWKTKLEGAARLEEARRIAGDVRRHWQPGTSSLKPDAYVLPVPAAKASPEVSAVSQEIGDAPDGRQKTEAGAASPIRVTTAIVVLIAILGLLASGWMLRRRRVVAG